MHRHTVSDTWEMASGRSSRAPSFNSDRPSVASSVTFQMPSSVRPPPAYIAASVAAQTVTDHHNAQLRQEDADHEELDPAVFSEQALSLLNAFLDHLLFAFLSSARSPSLTSVRPAISDVLKPRLAREAMEAADEELEGLLAGEDDEEFPSANKAADRWDVEKVWKRTRLRIMVYTRLGELEDEDEERYVQQERGLSMDEDDDDEAGLVSWASAIFLTSVVEYVAEQTLLIAGSAAFARMAAKIKKQARQSGEGVEQEPAFERLIIEEPDVEKIALNSALGRLWRTWRKRVRSPISPLSPGRGVRPVSSYSSFHNRKASHDTIDESAPLDPEPIPEHTPTETEIAANIPLPMGDNDIDEIEVPGLANTFEDDVESSGMQTPVPRARRPSSLIVVSPIETPQRRTTKERPLSMPLRSMPLFSFPAEAVVTPTDVDDAQNAQNAEEAETPFETSLEQPYQESYFKDEAEEGESRDPTPTQAKLDEKLPESPDPDAEMVAFAATTGMGFRMSTVDPIQTRELAKSEEPELPSAGGYESEPKVLQSKRMSIEKKGPPGVVRTFSNRSKSLQQSPAVTPEAVNRAGTSYLHDDVSDEEPDAPQAIGVARTSDIPIRSTPTPPIEPSVNKGKSPGHGGYVEVQPRNMAPTSMPFQHARTPPAPADATPTVPDRSGARKEVHRRTPSGGEPATPTRLESPTSAPRRQDPTPPRSRVTSLPSLQEVDSVPSKSKERVVSDVAARSPTTSSPKRSPTFPNRDGPVFVGDKHVQRVPTGDSSRSHHSSDRSSLNRVTSTSSSTKKKSGSFTVTPTGRDSELSHRSRGLSARMSEEDREREFDSLVKGQDTVKFTLTPQNVRDLDDPTVQQIDPKPASSSVVVYPRANAEDSLFGTANLPKRSTSRSKGPVPTPHRPSPSKKVVTKPLAREPRIESESMRDFADFIRSTGPTAGQEKPVQPFVNISGSGPKSPNASTSSLGRKVSTKQTSSRNMEPRSPAGLSSGNDDLIDFIRQGPPNANNGEPRIPRNVAPFRTTVDSDQFDNMLGGHGNVESAYGSTSSTLESTQTVNSRTGLLPQSKVVQPAYSNTAQNLTGKTGPPITKTRRRVKDPYAIDVSDDENDDELTALPHSAQPQQQPKQESLMDFLNSMDPPSNNKPQPFMLSEETIAAARARATNSTASLSSNNTVTRNGNGNGVASYPASSVSVSSNAPGAYKPRLQARAPAVAEARAGGGKTATSDLADFLRNSGPPEVGNVAPVKVEEKKKRSFWKKK